MGDPEAIRLAAGALDGAMFTEPAFSLSSSEPRVLEFRERYRRRYGEDPEVWGATFYDAVELVARAWEGKPPTADALRSGLLSMRDFPGVTGSTTFLPNGDVQKAVEVRTIKDGKPDQLAK
jgi:branched-chain amino acid transport system substrate-binding protein